MVDAKRLVVSEILEQHVEEAAALADRRRVQVHAPHVNLEQLSLLDERLESRLDTVKAAGEAGWLCSERALSSGRPGALFTATVPVLEANHQERALQLLVMAEDLIDARAGFLNALAWISSDALRSIGALLLASANPFARHAGIVGCSAHGLDPGLILSNALKSPEPLYRARAYRSVGELGRVDLLAACIGGIRDGDESCRFWAAWSGVRLGNRAMALEALTEMYRRSKVLDARSDLVLLGLDQPRAHALLSEIAREPKRLRQLITGAGLVGDSIYVPWLIEQMEREPFARVAGEAFTLITGVDLEALELAADAPELIQGDTRDSEGLLLGSDPDEGLPWPDARKVSKWWEENKARFATGVRWFMGEPLSAESVLTVLRKGHQRQRRTAALHRALQNPNAVLFNCRAPASQQRHALG
jgi:uncharacterized protein (TIGR02270 family)